MYGIYMPQDLEKSINWFRRAIKSKVPGAQEKVNLIESMLGKEGVKNTNEYFAKHTIVNPTVQKKYEDKIEVITVTFIASYKHILRAARAQTCTNIENSSCQQQWSFINAPIIVLSKDINQTF
jgi:hypothetical protein